ncbi:glypican-1-like [Dendronephthya gigantea]|uniref:glypican-1-like n=1 Tax=Dendronephthya gigantea TaxID=151771 RepID=UPI001069C156|nr:glypican-1-like [Dendronephthya gigantea]
MLYSNVYIAILILVNLHYFIECGGRRQTLCLEELNAFSVSKTISNASTDTGPNICSSVFGCCNKTIENGMKSQITSKLMNLVHWRNERAIRQFEDVYDDLEGLFHDVLERTSESTIDWLQTQYVKTNIAQYTKPHIRTLFHELRTSVATKNLQNSTATFFRNFYPVVYQYMVSKKKHPEEYSDCLKDNMQVISPFKDIPQKLTAVLMKKLLPVQRFLRSLQTIRNILGAIDNIELSEECSSALVKMRYCSLCDGFSNVKPCLNYCVDVVSVCLEPYSRVEGKWSSFIGKLDNLRDPLAKSLDASDMFSSFQESLSESISHASHSNVAAKVSKQCGNITDYTGNKIISRKQKTDSTRDLGNSDLYIQTDVQNSYQNLPSASDISRKLIFLRGNLSDIKIHMIMFADNICSKGDISAPKDKKCWIGTGLGRYNADVPDDVISDNMKPNNSDTIVDDVLLYLSKAMKDLKTKSHRHFSVIIGSGYGSASGEGSGGSGEPEENREGSVSDCNNDDDEDCDRGSGGKDKNKEKTLIVADEPRINVGHTKRPTQFIVTDSLGSGANSYFTQRILFGFLAMFYLIFPR